MKTTTKHGVKERLIKLTRRGEKMKFKFDPDNTVFLIIITIIIIGLGFCLYNEQVTNQYLEEDITRLESLTEAYAEYIKEHIGCNCSRSECRCKLI